MLPLRRSAIKSARRARPSLRRQQPRRYAHDAHDSTHQTPHGPVNESLGRGFYLTLAALPTFYILYRISGINDPNSDPPLTRLINSFQSYQKRFEERNTLHTKMIERAAADRNLFINSQGSGHIELKFPEIFNTGSPYNVPAGHGSANLDKLIAHYQRKNAEEEDEKLRKLNATGWQPDKLPNTAPIVKAPNP